MEEVKQYLLDIGFDDAHLPELFNDDDKSTYTIPELMQAYADHKLKLLDIPIVVVPKGTLKTKPKRTLGDFDVWYKPCTRCGYDTAKSTKPKDGNKTCWKCGNFIQRDYTDRALKK